MIQPQPDGVPLYASLALARLLHASFRPQKTHPPSPPPPALHGLVGTSPPPVKPALNPAPTAAKMGPLRPHGTFWVQRLLYFAVSNKRMSHSRGSGRCSMWCSDLLSPIVGQIPAPFWVLLIDSPQRLPRKPSRVVQDGAVSPLLLSHRAPEKSWES